MARFLWVARDRNGVVRAVRDEAATAEQSKAALEATGYTHVELKTDDLAHAVQSVVGDPKAPLSSISAEDEVRILEGGPSRSPVWRAVLLRNWRSLLMLTGLLVLGLVRHQRGMTALAVVLGGILVACAHALESRSRIYTRINDAKVWARWREILTLLDRFDRLSRFLGNPQLAFESTRVRAQALAALGRKDEALRLFERYHGASHVPQFLYQSMLATVHDAAHDYDAALACRRAACDASPDTPAMWIDLAMHLARHTADVEGARAALTRAETRELTEMAKVYLPFVRGLIALRAERTADACRELEQAESGQIALVRLTPLSVGLLLLIRAYLCVACGRAGDTARARTLLAGVERFLTAHREDQLLADCRAAARTSISLSSSAQA
jgi:tetratricopeptide (TPR) repeat protein